MAQFDYKGFLKEGGIEKYLLEENFGNDIESRYQFIRPLMSRLNDSARTEMLIDGMEEARAEDDKAAFDFYFVEAMKELGLEDELMEADSLINPEAEEIDAEDLDAAADYFDSLAENDDVLDEMIAEAKFEVGDYVVFADDQLKGMPMRVIGVRKMFGSPLHAYTVEKLNDETAEYDETQLAKVMSPEEKANVFVREMEGEVQTENKLLKASNTLEDALNSVADDLTDEQIDKFTEMILDLRDKVKAQTNEVVSDPDKVIGVAQKQAKINKEDEWEELVPKIVGLKVPGVSKSDKIKMVKAILKQLMGKQ